MRMCISVWIIDLKRDSLRLLQLTIVNPRGKLIFTIIASQLAHAVSHSKVTDIIFEILSH